MWRSSSFRAFCAVVFPLIVALVAFHAVMYRVLREQLFAELEERAIMIASAAEDRLGTSSALSFDSPGRVAVERTLQSILPRHPAMERFTVFNQFGDIVVSWPDQEARWPLQYGLDDEANQHVRNRDRMVIVRELGLVYHPLKGTQDSTPLAILRLGYNKTKLLEPARSVVRFGLTCAFCTVIAACILAWGLLRNINREARRDYRRAIQLAISRQDLSARIDPLGASPDLVDATNAVNQLLDHFEREVNSGMGLERRLNALSERHRDLHQSNDDLLLATQHERNDLMAKIRGLASLIPYSLLIVDNQRRVLDVNPRTYTLLRLPRRQKNITLPEGLWNLIDSHFSAGVASPAEHQFCFEDPVSNRSRELLVRIVPLDPQQDQTGRREDEARRLLVALSDPNEDSLTQSHVSQSLIQLFYRTAKAQLRECREAAEYAFHHVRDQDQLLLDGIVRTLQQMKTMLERIHAYVEWMDQDEMLRRHVCEHLAEVLRRAVESAPRVEGMAPVDFYHAPGLETEPVQVPEAMVFLVAADITTLLRTVCPPGRIEVNAGLRTTMVEIEFALRATSGEEDLFSALSQEQMEQMLEVHGDHVRLCVRLIHEVIERAGGTSSGPVASRNSITWRIALPRRHRGTDSNDSNRVDQMVRSFFDRMQPV